MIPTPTNEKRGVKVSWVSHYLLFRPIRYLTSSSLLSDDRPSIDVVMRI